MKIAKTGVQEFGFCNEHIWDEFKFFLFKLQIHVLSDSNNKTFMS